MKYGYAYQKTGAAPMSWLNGPPNAARAADARALGSLGGVGVKALGTKSYGSLGDVVLPRPGAPEVMGDCGCGGGCGKAGVGDTSIGQMGVKVIDTVNSFVRSYPLPTLAVAIGLYLKFKKKR